MTRRTRSTRVRIHQFQRPKIPRELEVLGLVARGSTNREIAEALYLSPLTVETHVSRILTKLRARDRVQLVVIAYQAGLVSP